MCVTLMWERLLAAFTDRRQLQATCRIQATSPWGKKGRVQPPTACDAHKMAASLCATTANMKPPFTDRYFEAGSQAAQPACPGPNQTPFLLPNQLSMPCRRDLVLAAETSEEVAELLQDLGQLRVVPLLQALLFDA